MAAPGVFVSFNTVSIAVCSSGMDFGPLSPSAPNVLRKGVTNNNSAVAIRFVEINLANGAITRLLFEGFSWLTQVLAYHAALLA